jgi:hypothetical protein
LTGEEIVQLASELAVAILAGFSETEPVPEQAGDAMETFFRGHGIVAADDDEWRWVN